MLQHYIINCIKFINPKNIVTFTDNNFFFLSLKNVFKKKNLILLQYAWLTRDTFEDIYLKTKNQKFFEKFKIDYTCIWGKNSKNFYSHFIDTKYLTTGSIKNNFYKYKKKVRKDSIIFISVSTIVYLYLVIYLWYLYFKTKPKYYRNINIAYESDDEALNL